MTRQCASSRRFREPVVPNLQHSGLVGLLAIDTEWRPWDCIETTSANVAAAIRAHPERPLLNSPQSYCNLAYDAGLVIQTYNREVPVQFVLSLLKAVSASYNGDVFQSLAGTS
jgi:hypothetical protein